MRTEEVVLESGEEGTIETNSAWGKGLVRQSSLPSRKGEFLPPENPSPNCVVWDRGMTIGCRFELGDDLA